MWADTVAFWKNYNHAQLSAMLGKSSSGFAADSEVDLGRYIVQSWKDENGEDLYYFILVKRMPHAVDLRAPQIAWEFLKHYSRNRDGSLHYEVDVK